MSAIICSVKRLAAREFTSGCLQLKQSGALLPRLFWVRFKTVLLSVLAALLWNVVTVSYRQRAIPDELLGRVNSIYRFFGWGMMPIGALLGGYIVAFAEPDLGREAALRMVFVVSATGSFVMLAYGWLKLRLT